MSAYELISPTIANAPALAALAAHTFRETWQHLYSEEVMENYLAEACSEDAVAKELLDAAYHYWMICDGQKPVAYAKAGPVVVPAPAPIPARSVELRRLYVLPEYKRRGLGSQLLAAFETCARAQADAAYTCVWAENAPALALYHAAGFEKVGEYFFPLGDFTNLAISPDYILRKNYI